MEPFETLLIVCKTQKTWGGGADEKDSSQSWPVLLGANSVAKKINDLLKKDVAKCLPLKTARKITV